MNNILIFGHQNPDTDSICSSLVKESLEKKNGNNSVKAVRLGNVNKETQYVLNYLGIQAPDLINEVEEGQEVILVDHNEFNQSVNGIKNAKILSVVDHHRISNFETSEPLYYLAKPFGCTSTILFEEYKQNNINIDKKEAVLMASAIISDTLLLKSPTTTDHDRNALAELEKIAKDSDTKLYKISAVTGEGLNELFNDVAKILKTLPKEDIVEIDDKVIYTLEEEEEGFKVEIIDGEFIVTGPAAERLMGRVNIGDNESYAYMEKMLKKIGIEDELKKKGVKEGDTVKILEWEFEWYE